jgi:hypothetical protein
MSQSAKFLDGRRWGSSDSDGVPYPVQRFLGACSEKEIVVVRGAAKSRHSGDGVIAPRTKAPQND